ncbi:EndoU domain-containing protein [Granulicatella adiacens]
MSYHVKFNDITSMHGQTNQTIQQWGESLKNLQESIALLANQSELQGKAMTSAKSYMTEVHGTFIQVLTQLMNEYTASFLLYKDGYYQIDTHNHAELPEDVYKGLHSDLGKSKQRFEHQLEQLTAAKLRVAGLVNYQGTSHTKTKFKYEKLMKDIKHLDESITQYEEMHARQDLQAFKELLDATKSLLAEHSSRNRSLESYQSGAFGKLPSVQRFMVAYEQVTAQLNDRMGIIQAALERDQVRMEALHAEERTKQGLMNLVFGVLTFLAGVSALGMSGGTALPIVAPILKIAGTATWMYGASNSIEAGQNIYYGLSGDGKSFAMNLIRDTIFLGNGELYHGFGQVFTLTTGVFIPIAKTKSIAQGLSQFFWGTVGGLATGQAAYHGTKLLGGNEDTAQLMNLLGNFVGGYAVSKAVKNFSLNGKTVPKVESALEIKNRVLENIKASKAARESSKFKQYVAKEKSILDSWNQNTSKSKMYNMDDLAKLQHTENFTEKSLTHIFEGDINRRGQAGGYHYDMVEGTSGSIIEGTKSPSLNDAGVYEAKVEVNGIPKEGNEGYSTFFPDRMSPQEIVDTINEAYSNKNLAHGNKYIGKSSNGLKIGMYIRKSDGKIISAFPME